MKRKLALKKETVDAVYVHIEFHSLTQINEHLFTEACFSPSDRAVLVCHDKHTHTLQ